MMDFDEMHRMIMDKKITICETCDNFFDYIPQKRFCDKCYRARHLYQRKMMREENREKINARARTKYHEDKLE
jgi:hypothetical protein